MPSLKSFSIKALAVGSITIICLGLVAQLIFLLLAVYVTELSRAYPELSTILSILSYITGTLAYFLIMASGGYVVANLAPTEKLFNGALAGIFTTSLSLISSLNENGFTMVALVFLVSGTGFCVAGAMIWNKLHFSHG